MNYLTLESSLLGALRNTALFAHVASHTTPEENLNNAYTGGMPAAIIRLLKVGWVPVEGETRSYRGLAQVELTLLGPANMLTPEAWADMVEQARSILFVADPSATATLLEDATISGPQLQYKILMSYKLTQTVL
jgi:hypothetical protein